MNTTKPIRNVCSGFILLSAVLLFGCSVLNPAKIPLISRYSFDNAAETAQATPKIAVTGVAIIDPPTIVVSLARAAAGFDSQHMVYVRQALKLEYFQQSEWVDAPSAMLTPLVASALERSGRFSAVVQSPTSVTGQLRLNLEIVRLQQEFFSMPSRVRFTLRAHLLDTATRQVIAWREFDTSVVSSSEDAYGGVLAANSAIRTVMDQLAGFCVQAAEQHLASEKNREK